ncbi:hypothetical protein GLAREA_10877 [Glarea lozoyensis ATCC 20868]|uniref:Uncharacterized protein n=1 Tax=Glarea lozoyensis (strain ATCC 20868 / MF5171) TaxID=1116229 RepID=S3DT91_GLAL2|nr:uncharacterized protein GLAREA_10877 [Glarea lozoyensis ATCC 20868]EPE35181.1 hypothetical protein GLAREA_10877 [Glarea lozoyensis ATCC 20868]
MVKTSTHIRAQLQSFIYDIAVPDPKPFKEYYQQSTILYGGCPEGEPRDHVKLQHIPAVPKYQEYEDLAFVELVDRVLFQVTIHYSKLRRCTLIDCTVYGGEIEKSNLQDCQVRMKGFGDGTSEFVYKDQMSRKPYILDSQINHTDLFDAKIFNSTIVSSGSMRNCYIKNTLAARSFMNGCVLEECGVDDSELRNCEVVGTILTASVIEVKTLITFHKLPPEIRQMIYSLLININPWKQKLISALRADPVLHREVLEAYFKQHVFQLSVKNHRNYRSVPMNIMVRICKIHLDAREFFPTSDVSTNFPAGTKINSICIEFSNGWADCIMFYDITKLWLSHFSTVTKLKVVWKLCEAGVNYSPTCPPRSLQGAIKVANK